MTQPFGENTQAYISIRPAKDLVVFVHGYAGNHDATWYEFQPMVRTHKKFETADIIYYGYRSYAGQISEHADDLHSYLCELQQFRYDPVNAILRSWTGYERIIIVAHSMGAVLIRRAMLSAYHQGDTWIHNTKMILFAPAHNGTGVPKAAITGVHAVTRLAAALASLVSQTQAELDPKVSDVIPRLISDTQALLDRGKGDFTKAYEVVWAIGDRVVSNHPFCEDPKPIKVEGHSHSSVCKPISGSYVLPFATVLTSL